MQICLNAIKLEMYIVMVHLYLQQNLAKLIAQKEGKEKKEKTQKRMPEQKLMQLKMCILCIFILSIMVQYTKKCLEPSFSY